MKNLLLRDDSIQYISCSATIHNPVSHFRTVCSLPENELIVHVDQDGSPCCEKN